MGKLKSWSPREAVFSAAMFALAVLTVFPFVVMLSASLKTQATVFSEAFALLPSHPNWSNYALVMTDEHYLDWYRNNVVAVAASVGLRLAVTIPAAYAFARMRFRLRDALFYVLVATMMITPETTIVPRYLFYKKICLLDSLWVIILPEMFEVFYLFMLRQFFMDVPKEFSEAAFMDGATHPQVLARVIAPLAKPAIVTVVLFSFIYVWNDFMDPYIFINTSSRQMLTAALRYFQDEAGANVPAQLAGASTAIVPIIVLFAATQKYFVEGLSSSGIKG